VKNRNDLAGRTSTKIAVIKDVYAMEEFFNKFLRNWGKPGAVLEILRPWNATLGAVMAVIGYLFVSNGVSFFPILITFILFYITWGATNAINDVFDYDIDKINVPFRPLHDGRLSQKEAKLFVIASWLISALMAAYLNFYLFIGIAFVIILSILYSVPPIAFERHWITANTSLGIMFVFMPAYGGAIYGMQSFNLPTAFYYAFLSFSALVCFLLLGKDLKDAKGDKEGGKFTLNVAFGSETNLAISIVGTLIFYILTTSLFYEHIPKILFLIFAIPIYGLIIFFQLRFKKLKTREALANNFGLLRLSFFLYGLLILFLLS